MKANRSTVERPLHFTRFLGGLQCHHLQTVEAPDITYQTLAEAWFQIRVVMTDEVRASSSKRSGRGGYGKANDVTKVGLALLKNLQISEKWTNTHESRLLVLTYFLHVATYLDYKSFFKQPTSV